MGPVVSDTRAQFGDPRINLSRDIPPEAICGGIFEGFFRGSFRPEAVSDVVSAAVIDPTCVKVPVKFGDSKSNRSRDTRLPHFVTNDYDDDDDDAGRRTLWQ